MRDRDVNRMWEREKKRWIGWEREMNKIRERYEKNKREIDMSRMRERERDE